MSVTALISHRYFTGKKKMFAGFLSVVAVLGVALGVFALTVVMSVMQGFGRDVQDKLVGFNAHVVVSSMKPEPAAFKQIVSDVDALLSGSAVMVEGEGIADVAGRQDSMAQGVKIRGLERADLQKLQFVKWTDLSLVPEEGSGALLGSELMVNLDIVPYQDTQLTILVPFGHIGPTGDIVPSKMNFPVTGAFTSGYFEHDSKTVILKPKDAKRLLGDNATHSLHLWLKDISLSDKAAGIIRAKYPELEIGTWKDSNKKLFAALKLERIAMSLLLVLIIAIASVSIISVIFMYVYARRKDIAILTCIGMKRSEIRWIFLRIGGYIGITGTAVGLMVALPLCYYLKQKPFILPSSYYLDHLPVLISLPFIFAVGICGVLIAMLGALYPSDQAARIDPMELIRYE